MNAGIRNYGKAPGKLKKRPRKLRLPELGTRARMLEVAEFHETAQFKAQAARCPTSGEKAEQVGLTATNDAADFLAPAIDC